MKHEIIKLKENIYRIYAYGVHEDLFIGTDVALLWDTGCGEGGIRKCVDELIGNKKLIVVNSHGHPDHAFGNFEFTDCDTYIHEEDIRVLKEEYDTEELRKWTYENMLDQNCSYALQEYIAKYKTSTFKCMKEKDVFELGGISLKVIHLPGHTAGSCGMLYQEEGWFYSGDCISPWQFLPESTGLLKWYDSLKKMRNLPFDRMYASHMREPQEISYHGEKREIEKYIRGVEAAWNRGYQKGFDYPNPVFPEEKVKAFMLEEYGEKDMMRANTVCAIVTEEKFDARK